MTSCEIVVKVKQKVNRPATKTHFSTLFVQYIDIFVRQSLRERGIPFKITEAIPNKETVSAMLEAERIAKDSSVKGYHDVDELFADLDS